MRILTTTFSPAGINSQIVKGICRVIGTTLTKYKDMPSQNLMKKLIRELTKSHTEWTLEHFNGTFKYLLAKELTKEVPPVKLGPFGFLALQWSIIILTDVRPMEGIEKYKSEIDAMLVYQSHFYQMALQLGNVKITRKTNEVLTEFWAETDFHCDTFSQLIDMEQAAPNVMLMLAGVMNYLHENNSFHATYDEHKEKLHDHFIKTYITVKEKPNSNLLCSSKLIINSISETEFESKFLPAIQRAMLRNPEIVLKVAGIILSELEIDLSGCAFEIGKVLIQNLYSNNSDTRQESVDALKSLSEKCSQSKAIDDLLEVIFKVWNSGADGKKITLIELRLNILRGIGNLSYNSAMPEDLEKSVAIICENFFKILSSETHDKILCLALEVFSLWSENLMNELPKNFINVFKGGLENKATSQAVRIGYMEWLLCCLDNTTLPVNEINSLIPILLKVVEKSTKDQQQQQSWLTINEALCASCLILHLIEIKKSQNLPPTEDDAMRMFWSVVFDLNKQVFQQEKFLINIPPSGLKNVMFLSEKLLNEYYDKLKGDKQCLFRAIVYSLHAPDINVRSYCLALVRKLRDSQEKGIEFINNLLLQLKNFLCVAHISAGSMESCDENNSIPASAVIDTLETICSPKSKNINLLIFHNVLMLTYFPLSEPSLTDSDAIARNALLCCHHQMVYSLKPELWEEILVDQLNLESVKLFIKRNSDFIKKAIIETFEETQSQMYENSVVSLTKLDPEQMLAIVVEAVAKELKRPEMANVSDSDYFTYLTPAGELYDRSVLPTDTINQSTAQLKRESKVYSYKEQLEEIQLRKELEEKRRKEGKAKPVQYTPKQKEAIKAQMDKEEGIRSRLKDLHQSLIKIQKIIDCASKGNGEIFSQNFAHLLPGVLNLFHSPLAAPVLVKMYFNLREIAFVGDDKALATLGTSLAKITIRLYEPHCDLDPEWVKEDIKESVVRNLNDLAEYTSQITNNDEEDDENETDYKHLLTAPAFCYAFMFLNKALRQKQIRSDEELMVTGIQVMSRHAQMRGETEMGSEDDFRHPKYMPRLEMLEILLKLICEDRGRVQTQAVAAFLDVAESSSGKAFAANPTRDIFEILLWALESRLETIRDVALRALLILIETFENFFSTDPDLQLLFIRRLWIAKHDVCEENKEIAEVLWENARLTVPNTGFTDELMKDIIHPESDIQRATALALVSVLEEDSSSLKEVIKKLFAIYNEKLEMIPAKVDQFDRIVESAVDQWGQRRGVGYALYYTARFLNEQQVYEVIQFMVSKGLGDRDEMVHKEMLSASLEIVELHGKVTLTKLLAVFDDFLDKAPKSSHYDNIRQAVVVLMGSLARHLEKDDERIPPIVRRLITALSTPSESVQEAVANCLPHLVPHIKDDVQQMVKKLLHQLTKSDNYGERRGAAYGIAGIVKGLGILSLKQMDIMPKLTTYIQEKKNYKSREGALFAFEMLCKTLGRLFEPYIVHVLPHLLNCFGDSTTYVRRAADDAAKVVMAKLSAHGVKLVLPSLLNALDDDSWRTKTASVELLGAMAYCAPKQLSSCLPSIVPKLIEVLGDSHAKVQEAGAGALKVIGSVIKNPEIQAIVPILLKALEDPSNKTSKCLHSLLETKFVHFIDAPSLALIMPVVQRAFMDRSTETRKMAAKIIGNMYSLTDQKDLTPYLPNIIPGLKMSLLDPVPEVRAVSARALGAMVRGMGESSFEDLLPWLMQTLTSESSSVDRSGAAQGLSEVVGGLGVEKLHKLMPEIIATAERNDIAPHVKDGYIMMFIYMPAAFPNEFTPYIGQIINPILKALADENEYVRETALKAGQRIVHMYAESAIALLLPELEKGLFNDNWRIRFSSVQLLGDLLYRISGVSGKMTTQTASDDDNFGTEQSHSAIINSLGPERRNRVLAGLYMGRSDVSLMVRQAALHVWKVVVTNTPRTLREILPTLFSLLLGCLASTSYDKRQVAARTLGDLVRKLGERVLPEIIPILERGLNSDQADQRQGVCIGLSEIMASTSKDMVLTFVNSLVPTVRRALCDPLPEVRQAAAKTFDSLHSTVGSRALDDILPSMLNGLSDPDPEIAENTLDGLRQVMAIKSRVVLPYLVPQLTMNPVNTKALSILASVAGESLTKYLPKILPALLSALTLAQGQPNETAELEYCQAVILSVSDEVGVRTIMDTLMESTRSTQTEVRRAAATLMCAFCSHSPGDYSQYIPQLLRGLLRLLADSDKEVLQRSWDALNAVTKTLDSGQQIAHVSDVRQAVRFATSDLKNGEELPGFCLPKGISPLLPVFREAILNGLPEEKENAAQGLGEVINLTSAASLQPSVVHITGPLIRILGDRFNSGVKAAVLETLAILLKKVGIMLKQFLPQLQTTFLKALHDSNRTVRIKAGQALGQLVMIHSRADPLFTEMHNGIKGNDDSAERETMLQALRGIITPAGDKMTEVLRKQIYQTLVSMLNHPEDVTRSAVGGCLGAICKWLSDEQLDDAMLHHILVDETEDWALKHGRTAALFVALKEHPSRIYTPKYEPKIIKFVTSCLQSDKIPIASNGVRAGGFLLIYCLNEGVQLPTTLLAPFIRSMNHQSNEVKQILPKMTAYLAGRVTAEKTTPELLRPLIPMLVNGTKEKNGYVKSNSELALVAVLRLRSGDETHQKCLALLEVGARESLSEVVTKVLRKVALQPIGKEEELDETILS